ncbi:orotidine-5'-phosphate decarboxylase [Bryocella elongata]|uniref:Orotidine-5'-phosphate decarboxylase n=1 Tax=Bryocella elongata TaxID=863522 RepID=A0A1H5YHP8_9BACT|nr:orotidine-5'-phosphate decarboxylase [Bryocella elongata]SEG23145.1 orotidine-5'-phosphate decarboxylase [Bryocella elongata]
MSAIAAKYARRVAAIKSLVCVGLDSEQSKLPARFQKESEPQFAFNRWIIDQTKEFAAAYKPNTAFYESRGSEGWREFERTLAYIQRVCPDAVTICDAKRADIGNTNRGYVEGIFDRIGFDSITLHPYLGGEALEPFLAREDKAAIILCRTSNPGASDVQDLIVTDSEKSVPLWESVANKVNTEWNKRGNCMLVVGATYPEEMRRIRAIAPEMTFLVPGIGAQGGDVKAVIEAGLDANGAGLMISASRSILFAPEPGVAARALRDEINAAIAEAMAQREGATDAAR